MFIYDKLKEKSEEEAWDEAYSYLDEKAKKKRIKSYGTSKKIYAAIVGLILILVVIFYSYTGLTSEIDILSFILYGSLITLSGLFAVFRIYFIGLVWTPLLYLLGVYINQKYGDKERKWSIDEQIEFLWFSVIIIGGIGSLLLNIIYSIIGYSFEDLNPLMLVVWNLYIFALLYYATSRSLKLRKSNQY